MPQMDPANSGASHPSFKDSHLKQIASEVLIYIGIATVFASVTVILWFVSLLIA